MMVAAMNNSGAKMVVEVERSTEMYRLVVNSTEPATINSWGLRPPQRGVSPWGVGIQIKREDGSLVQCDLSRSDYSSASLSSDDPFPENQPVVVTRESSFSTDWYRMADLFSGIGACASKTEVKGWKWYKIKASAESSEGKLTAESEWLPYPK